MNHGFSNPERDQIQRGNAISEAPICSGSNSCRSQARPLSAQIRKPSSTVHQREPQRSARECLQNHSYTGGREPVSGQELLLRSRVDRTTPTRTLARASQRYCSPSFVVGERRSARETRDRGLGRVGAVVVSDHFYTLPPSRTLT